ncbi:MAG: hypothetical protein IPQ04_12025 [Saprospiraceae bacterium]|nr:hypothetical protein [Saprospiraceae bacterium]
MIEKFSQELNLRKGQLDIVRKEINDSMQKIEITSDSFLASFNLVYGQIQEDVQKINQNLIKMSFFLICIFFKQNLGSFH